MQADKTLTEHLKQMPPLNSALQKTLMLLNEKNSDYKKISGTILQDPVLAGRVLQLANSSFYGSQRQVADLGIACTMLGLETLKGLTYTLILLTKFRNGPEHSVINYDLLWKYCLRVACLVKHSAKEMNLNSSVGFTAGLFHCMDLIIQDYFYSETLLQRINSQPNNDAPSPSPKISTIIDTAYWALIATLLEFWKFPPAVVDVFKGGESVQARRYQETILECALFIKKIQLNENQTTQIHSENTTENPIEKKLSITLQNSDILYAELEVLLFH